MPARRRPRKKQRGTPVKRYVLAALMLLAGISLATDVFAQANQTSPPVPLVAPSLNTGTLTCQVNCDTTAMNCQNSCVPTGAPSATLGGAATPGAGSGACNLACSTQQLVCKQRC
jgi:hypothetical protein